MALRHVINSILRRQWHSFISHGICDKCAVKQNLEIVEWQKQRDNEFAALRKDINNQILKVTGVAGYIEGSKNA